MTRKVQNILGLGKRKLVTEAVFQSVLCYCIPLWGGATKREIEDLQVIQNSAARLVLKLQRGSSRKEMFRALQWLTLHQLIVYYRIMAVYNIRSNQEPEYLFKKLSNDNIRGNIIIPNTNLSILKKSFIFAGSELWNSIPKNRKWIFSE